MEHLLYFPDLSSTNIYPFPCQINVLKGQWFVSAEEVTAKVTSTDRIIENGFLECFQKLYEHWKKFVTVHGNHSEGNVV
jgi:hypothetical protein